MASSSRLVIKYSWVGVSGFLRCVIFEWQRLGSLLDVEIIFFFLKLVANDSKLDNQNPEFLRSKLKATANACSPKKVTYRVLGSESETVQQFFN